MPVHCGCTALLIPVIDTIPGVTHLHCFKSVLVKNKQPDSGNAMPKTGGLVSFLKKKRT